MRGCLVELSARERDLCPSLDRPADTFARLLQSAAPAEGTRGRVLGQLLYHLGRWIYLADARDDLEEDRQAGRYNPVTARYGPQGDDGALALTMDQSLGRMGEALQLGDFGCRSALLENMIYLGLPLVQRAVFDGSWAQIKKQKISLDISRGKPCPQQMDITMPMLDTINSATQFPKPDYRNYGGLEGIPELRALFAQILGVEKEETSIGGNWRVRRQAVERRQGQISLPRARL